MSSLRINPTLSLPDSEIEWHAMRAGGSGGQNVNKVSSAVHLRFDIQASSLPDDIKQRLLGLDDARLTEQGELVIKAQRFRSQQKNLDDARERLAAIIRQATVVHKPRRPTRPSLSAKRRRLDSKRKQSQTKAMRGKIPDA